jgi:hypothetical protein
MILGTANETLNLLEARLHSDWGEIVNLQDGSIVHALQVEMVYIFNNDMECNAATSLVFWRSMQDSDSSEMSPWRKSLARDFQAFSELALF